MTMAPFIPLLLSILLLIPISSQTLPFITTSTEITTFLTYDEDQLKSDVHSSLENYLYVKKTLLKLPKQQRTFENVIAPLDEALGLLTVQLCRIEALSLVLSDDKQSQFLRERQSQIETLFYDIVLDFPLIDVIDSTKTGKKNIKKWKEKWALCSNCSLASLSNEQKNNIKKLFRKNSELSHQFSLNIQRDTKGTEFSHLQLQGLDETFLNSLDQTQEGLYKVNLSYPVYVPIMKKCTTASVRETLYEQFSNRAHPENLTILEELIQTRNLLAKELQFNSYAEMDISSEMAKNPLKVEQFLDKLILKSSAKATEELNELIKDHKDLLTTHNKIQLHDLSYLFDQYNMKTIDLDSEKLRPYFPIERVMNGMKEIFENFFSLKISTTKASQWNLNIPTWSIFDKETDQLLGHIQFDLFPREGKYSHACCCPIIPAVTTKKLTVPALALIITNFPKEPSFLSLSEVNTLFHEFGHSLHAVLGRSELALTASCSVPTDFVEVPSQLLEKWLTDTTVLQKISQHPETKEPISLNLVQPFLRAEDLHIGYFITRQALLSKFSLALYNDPLHTNPKVIQSQLYRTILPQLALSDDNHFYLSFSHLAGYGAKYYSYLWSKIIAEDLFDSISNNGGPLNASIGKRYRTEVLEKAGNNDIEEVLENFLKRPYKEETYLLRLDNPL